MKVQSVKLKHFKRFQEQEFDFSDPETGLARDLIVIVGMNGAGKTSLLQAIAATLGTATGRLKKPSDLDWPGFNYPLIARNWGEIDPEIDVTVQFSSSELQAIQDFRNKIENVNKDLFSSDHSHIFTLSCKKGRVSSNQDRKLLPFKGREYAKRLQRSEGYNVFEKIGTIFWYTEQRTSTSLTSEDSKRKLVITEDVLRDRLSKWRQIHQDIQSGNSINYSQFLQKDLYSELEKYYKIIFPNRSFGGLVLREDIDDIFSEPWFYLCSGETQYEISEMSGGERAVFPILMDFANWHIHNSVILIDELELHLHPPMQQALLRALPKLGKNNQFIITTHSDYIAEIVSNEYLVRLDEDF